MKTWLIDNNKLYSGLVVCERTYEMIKLEYPNFIPIPIDKLFVS